MGHTLTARFEEKDLEPVLSLLSKWDGEPVNKIPFGRDCDRDTANQILPYHMTVLHWARSEDKAMLEKMKSLTFSAVPVIAESVQILFAEESSRLLYLPIRPTAEYEEWACVQERIVGRSFSSFLHMTLAVSKNASEIDRLARFLKQNLTFPFELRIRDLELYHIWKPVRLVQTWNDPADPAAGDNV